MHSFNCKWSLGITALARLRGVTSLAKPEKLYNALSRKIRKTAIIVDKNRKPKVKLEKTHKPLKTPKPKNRSFKVRKPKNRTKNWPNPQNRKSQRSPVLGVSTLSTLVVQEF